MLPRGATRACMIDCACPSGPRASASSASRMTRLGKSELVDDELLSIDEVLARIDGVTLDDVRTLAAELFAQPEILAVVGPR